MLNPPEIGNALIIEDDNIAKFFKLSLMMLWIKAHVARTTCEAYSIVQAIWIENLDVISADWDIIGWNTRGFLELIRPIYKWTIISAPSNWDSQEIQMNQLWCDIAALRKTDVHHIIEQVIRQKIAV